MELENQIPMLAVLAFITLLFIAVKKPGWKSHSNGGSTLKLPPGPKKLPLIGNLHQLTGGLPHHSLTKLAKIYGPLMHLKLGELSTVVVSSPEMAEQVMKTHDVIFATRPTVLASKYLEYDSSGVIFSPFGAYWRYLRKICTTELLSSKRVESFRCIREEEVSNFIKVISSNEGSSIDLSDEIFSLLYRTTARTAFGVKTELHKEFMALVPEAMKLFGGFYLADLYPSVKSLPFITGMSFTLKKMHKKLDRILEQIILSHREGEPKRQSLHGVAEEEDFVDVLLKVQKDSDLQFPLSDSNVKAVITDIFIAGSETVATTLEWAMAEMIRNQDVTKEAQAEVRSVFNGKRYVDEQGIHELKYLKAVIKETLRLHPPAPLLLPRVCTDKCEIDGYEIPIKTRVFVNAYAINRDPRYWVEPDKFWPERFLANDVDYKGADFHYVPFGAGRRICPGILYGMANLELTLAMLIYHFDWKLPNGMKHGELNMDESFGVTVRRKNNLVLVPVTYRPSA